MNINKRLTEEEIITGLQRRALKWKEGKVNCWSCCDEGTMLNPPKYSDNNCCMECINEWCGTNKETETTTIVKHIVIQERLACLERGGIK